MSYIIEVTEKIEVTIKRKVEVDSLISDDINNAVKKTVLDLKQLDKQEIVHISRNITKTDYKKNTYKFKFLNGLCAVKVTDCTQSKCLIDLAIRNGTKNDITEDTYISEPYYYVRPNPWTVYAAEKGVYILTSEKCEYNINLEIVMFEDVFIEDAEENVE